MAKEPRILIVDDSRLARVSASVMLEAAGYRNLLEAGSAAEAFRLLGLDGSGGEPGLDVDLILLDVILPDMDGISVCRRLKSHEATREAPVIMVTGQKDLDSLSEAFQAGALDYITKPIRELDITARVRSAIALKQESDRRRRKEAELVKLAARLSEANQALRRLANLDGLTGVANRRVFEQEFEMEWRRAQRAGSSLAVVMMDIDHFKLYNDHYGHQGGDECLKAVARSLAAQAKRPGDLLARYGGEEFVALLPATEVAGALDLAQEMREAVAALNLAHAASPVADRVSLSLGVAAMRPAQGQDRQELLARADKALYQAKKQGRDRAVAAEQST